MISWTKIRFNERTRLELHSGASVRPLWSRFLHRGIGTKVLCANTLGREIMVLCSDVAEIRGATVERELLEGRAS